MGVLTKFLINKIDVIVPKRKYRGSEEIINYSSRNKIRSLEVEELYNKVKYEFNRKIKGGNISRNKILQIRKYLSKNVIVYYPKKFKNDAHAIYTMLKAKDLKIRDLEKIEKML